MSKVIKLPSGQTATWKDRLEYTLKDRKFVLAGVKTSELDELEGMLDILERVVLVSVTEWSFDLLPPSVRAESLESPLVSLADVDALLSEAKESLASLMPNLQAPADGSAPDPKAITSDSVA